MMVDADYIKSTASDIGREVRRHRRAAGLAQKDLADLAGVGKTAVFDIEKGKHTVRMSTLLAVLNTLNIQVRLCSPLEPGANHA